MIYEDKQLDCRDCHKPFTFNAGEQEYFAQKQLVNTPKRCPSCRLSTKLRQTGKDPDAYAEIPCHNCGMVTTVPFKPTGTKPVYCRICFKKECSQ